MTTLHPVPNPFALMMDPDAVFAALARSDRLARLKSQVCRPLDKPMGKPADADALEAEADAKVDAEDDPAV